VIAEFAADALPVCDKPSIKGFWALAYRIPTPSACAEAAVHIN